MSWLLLCLGLGLTFHNWPGLSWVEVSGLTSPLKTTQTTSKRHKSANSHPIFMIFSPLISSEQPADSDMQSIQTTQLKVTTMYIRNFRNCQTANVHVYAYLTIVLVQIV